MSKNPRLIDLSGQKYGMWTVGAQAGNSKGGGALWNATCDCGTSKVVRGGDVRHGKSTNCGCLKTERIRNLRASHGETKTRIYSIWKGMRARTKNANNPGFKNYGGRGIFICRAWDKFETFRDWAMDNGYQDNLSIERIDVNKGYSPENCTWADDLTQSNNRRFVRKMPDGRSAPLTAQENGIPAKTFNVRVFAGWSIEEAATHPYRKRRVPRRRDEHGKFA